MALIETTKDGRPYYIVRWNYRSRTIDGKPYDSRAFRAKKDAEAWQLKVGRSPTTRGGRVLVTHIMDAWLEQHVRGLERRTYLTDEQSVRLRIRPGIGSKVADKLTAADCSRWVRRMLEDGVQPPTVNKTLRIAKAAMRWGRSEGLTTCRALEDTRGARDTRPREERRSRAKAYTPVEIARLVASCRLMIESAVILTAKDSGLRRSELFALCWDKVDLAHGLIHVHRALDVDGSFKNPKTHEYRTVPLLRDGLAALREWREHAPDTELVFPSVNGHSLNTTWESSHAGKYVKRRPTTKPGTKGGEPVRVLTDGIRKRSGIWLELNQLRDTYASTLLFMAKATPEEIRMALGHKSIQTTLDHYAEWFEPSRSDLAARANAQLEALSR